MLILDCDVRQGDGSTERLQDENRIFTCSLHRKSKFPYVKHSPDLEIGLAVGIKDGKYLDKLETCLAELITELQPDYILYDTGVDIH